MAKIYLKQAIPHEEFFRISQFMTRLGGECADLARKATSAIDKRGELFICNGSQLHDLINKFKQVSK